MFSKEKSCKRVNTIGTIFIASSSTSFIQLPGGPPKLKKCGLINEDQVTAC